MLKNYFVDLHIHLGQDRKGNPIKISASKKLTLQNILQEAHHNKGLNIIGIIDCHVPEVINEITELIDRHEAYELEEGGIRFGNITLILGSEIELYDEHCQGPIHVLVYVPTIDKMKKLSRWLQTKMTNYTLSSQRYYGTARELQHKIKELMGLFIPAHVFTPFKSLYGRGVSQSLTEVFDPTLIDGIELGLSSDTTMANKITELEPYAFLTNSDSHSLHKIAREYQCMHLKKPTFNEIKLALKNEQGRRIVANYGMNPKLGKYYRTVCRNCLNNLKITHKQCPQCDSTQIVRGVFERIEQLKDKSHRHSRNRPPYVHQVPLDYIPKLGPKILQRLLKAFQTEMNIIHHVSYEQLIQVVSPNIADMIIANRKGKLQISSGGGGKYGRIIEADKN